jgi:hypothetical protein
VDFATVIVDAPVGVTLDRALAEPRLRPADGELDRRLEVSIAHRDGDLARIRRHRSVNAHRSHQRSQYSEMKSMRSVFTTTR